MFSIKPKNNGFTLSEVLITLVIIGVVAAITVPSVMNNTNKQEYISGYKKMYSTINQVFNRIKADNGGVIAGVFTSDDQIIDVFSGIFREISLIWITQFFWLFWNNFSNFE